MNITCHDMMLEISQWLMLCIYYANANVRAWRGQIILLECYFQSHVVCYDKFPHTHTETQRPVQFSDALCQRLYTDWEGNFKHRANRFFIFITPTGTCSWLASRREHLNGSFGWNRGNMWRLRWLPPQRIWWTYYLHFSSWSDILLPL